MKKHIILMCILIMAALVFANAAAMSEYDAMVRILEETGIVSLSDVKDKETPVTRAQFVKMAAGLSVYPVQSVTVPGFDDVPPSHDAYTKINEARAKGIISGTGENLFSPDENIEYEQACAMVINAMGLKEYASNIGGYALGYRRIAQMLDMTDIQTVSGALTFEGAVEMLYNALNSRVINTDVISSGYIQYAQDKEETYLNSYFDIYFSEGYVNSIDNTVSDYDSKYLDGGIVIDGKMYTGECEDYFEYIGRYVGYFYKKKSANVSVPEFLLMYNTDTDKAWQMPNDSITSFENSRVYYQGGETEKSVKVNSFCDVIYNKRFAPDYDLKKLPGLKSGRVSLVSKDGGNEVNLIVIEEVRSAVIKSVDTEQMKIYFEDKTVYGGEEKFIKLKEGSFALKDMQNIDVDIKDLKPGYVVSVSESADKEYAYVTVSDSKIKILSAEVGDDKLLSDGKEYIISDDLDRDKNTLLSDGEIIFYLDKFGHIIASDDSFAQNEHYGYFVEIIGEENSNKPIYLKIFDENGKFSNIELSEKIRINGGKKTEAKNIFSYSELSNSTEFIKQVIKYSLANGKISKIETANDRSGELNYIGFDEDSFTKDYYSLSNSMFKYVSKVIDNKYIINADTVIFLVPSDKTDYDEYSACKVGAFSSDVTRITNLEIYDADKTKNAALMVMNKNSVLFETNAFIVSKISKTTDINGDEIYRLEGFFGGAERILYISDKKNISVGDLLSVAIGADDKIEKYEIMAPVGEYKSDKEPTDLVSSTNLGSMRVAVRGEISEISANAFTLSVNKKVSPLAFPRHTECAVYNYFPKTKKVTAGNFSDIGNGARVFVHRYYDSARTIVIYQD